MKMNRHLCWERAQQQLKIQRLMGCNKLSWTRAMARKKSLMCPVFLFGMNIRPTIIYSR